MDDEYRADERRRREAAQAGTATVEGGEEVRPRALKQMLSVRFEPQLLRELRLIADQRGVSVSDILRQAAVDFLDRARRSQFVFSASQTATQQPTIRTGPAGTTGIGSVASPPAKVA